MTRLVQILISEEKKSDNRIDMNVTTNFKP
jgi:hypothetical protein